MPACCRAGRCGEETRSGSNNSGNRACSFHQGSRRTSEESSRETTTSRPGLPAGSHPGSRPYVCLPGGRTRTQKGTSIVNQPHTLRLSSWARLVGLALLLGILAVAVGVGRPAYAATTLTVTNCSTDSQLQADVSTADSDNAGDTITFACNGAIPLTSTLTISGSMTLDGSGQQVTLDGQHSREVLFVNFGVSFTLKALTIANGSSSILGEGGGIENNGGAANTSHTPGTAHAAPPRA